MRGHRQMRLMTIVIAVALHMAAPADAAWKQHAFPELGFSVDFPADTKTSKGEWKGAVARNVPTTMVSTELDHITYQAIVADFSNRLSELPSILGEAVYILSLEGAPVEEVMARIETGQNAIYGRRIAVALKDGGKKTSEVFATHGKLYVFTTTISAAGDTGSPTAARFRDSISFAVAANRNP
jgi:hypothetical protein